MCVCGCTFAICDGLKMTLIFFFFYLKCSLVQNTQRGTDETVETLCSGPGGRLVCPFEYMLILVFAGMHHV